MGIPGAQNEISLVVLSWKDTEVHPHRFGGVEYRLGRRELGHIHGDHLVDIPFPTRIRDEIVAIGQARPHHIQPESGWVSCFLRRPEDVGTAIQLLRRSYDLAIHQRRQRESTEDASAPLEEDERTGFIRPSGQPSSSSPGYTNE